MATSALTAEFQFADESTRSVTFQPYATNDDAVTAFKVNVMDFNQHAADSSTEKFRSTFLSNDGASCTGIKSATITTTEKTLIYAKNQNYALTALAKEDSDNGNNG